MINSEVAKSTYLIQAGVTTYPIGFEYHFNPDNTPQVAVKINDTLAGLNVDFVLSTDKSSIVLIPTPEEEEALTGPLDFSWMDRLVGKHLFVYRDIEFLQNSDYQVGRIDPEQIEKDFDESVMRDQILRQGYVDLAVKVTEACGDAEHAIEIANNASGVAAEALEVAESANEKSDEALTNSEDAVAIAASAKDDARNALTKAGEANAKSDQAMGTADGAMEVAAEAVDIATEAKDAVESKQDRLTPGANVTIVDNVISSTGAVHSVNGKTGAVNLTIADLGAASADEVATIKNDQDELGDQVSIIEGKIPGSASTSNQLATASDIRTTNASVTAVGDRVTTLRADMNTGLSEIQTQVTAQASAIAGKIDQQQDAGNAGKALIIGEDGVVVPGEMSSDEYLPLAGGRMQGKVWFDYGLTVGTVSVAMQATNWLRVGITADYSYSFKDSGFYPQSSTQELGASSNPWRRLYTGTINNGEDLIVPTSGGTLARLEDIPESGGGDYLPLTGGTLTGPLTFEWSSYNPATPSIILKAKLNRLDTGTVVENDILAVLSSGEARFLASVRCYSLGPATPGGIDDLGTASYCFRKTFTKSLNAGYRDGVASGDLIVPTTAGTLARIEDIDAAVGDISTALTAIIGE